jgi:hypothetical protein
MRLRMRVVAVAVAVAAAAVANSSGPWMCGVVLSFPLLNAMSMVFLCPCWIGD